MRQIRTDLALEATEQTGSAIPGIKISEREEGDGILVTCVKVTSKEGERAIGKPVGSYITVECPELGKREKSVRQRYEKAAAAALSPFLTPARRGNILIVGLGNRQVTPDALGPKVCDKVFVTRHIKEFIPEAIDERAATVSAIAPGVLGVTGIETGEVIRGICERITPSLVLAIDALASRSIHRIGTSIQIADTGISPGSGIGNKRSALNRETLGVPVISIGVPLVVYAATIAGDLIESVLGEAADHPNMRELMHEVMSAKGADLIVTPKDIDVLVESTARTLAETINLALNPDLSAEEMEEYMN